MLAPAGVPLKAILITSLSAVTFGATGVGLIVWANKIARFYKNHYASNRFLKSIFPLRAWVETSYYYETMIKVVGTGMIGMAVLLLFIMIRGLLEGQT